MQSKACCTAPVQNTQVLEYLPRPKHASREDRAGESADLKDFGFAGPSVWLEAGVPTPHCPGANQKRTDSPTFVSPRKQASLHYRKSHRSFLSQQWKEHLCQLTSVPLTLPILLPPEVGQQQAPCWDRTGACQRRVTPLQTHSDLHTVPSYLAFTIILTHAFPLGNQ